MDTTESAFAPTKISTNNVATTYPTLWTTGAESGTTHNPLCTDMDTRISPLTDNCRWSVTVVDGVHYSTDPLSETDTYIYGTGNLMAAPGDTPLPRKPSPNSAAS